MISHQNKLLWLSLIIISANIFSGALGYLYQILIGRLLEPADFVIFSAVISLLVLFNSPLTTLLTVISKEVAHLKALNQNNYVSSIYKVLRKLSLYNALPLLLFYMLSYRFFMDYLKIDSHLAITMLFLLLFISPFCFINNGFLQGIQNFKWYSITTIAEVILKIALCLLFISSGLGLLGALGGVLMAMFLVQSLGSFPIKQCLQIMNGEHGLIQNFHWLEKYSKYIPLLFGNIALVVLTQLDILFINWYFPVSESSIYAVSSTLGKTILYLPAGIITAALPMIATKHAKNEESKSLLLQSVILALLFCSSLTLFFWATEGFLIPLLFGDRYDNTGNLLGWYCLSMMPISIAMVIESAVIAKGRLLFSWLYIIFAPIQLLSIVYLHTTLLSVIHIIGITGLFILIIGLGIMYFRNGKNKNV